MDETSGRPKRGSGVLSTIAWVLLGVSAVGLPVALVVAALDTVRRRGAAIEQGIVVAFLVVVAIVLVIAVERGITYAVGQDAAGPAIGGLVGLVVLVLAGVFIPGLGLVLTAVGVVLGVVVMPASLGLLAWWRWRTVAVPPPSVPPPPDEVRARAEERRAVVRARHDRTRAAVAAGLIGPGFTRGTRP